MITHSPKRALLGLLALALAFVALPATIIMALPYGSGIYGDCTYSSCGISISTNGNVSLTVTPTISGVYTTQNDSVLVTTDASTGYTLSFTDASTDNRLVSGGNFINSSSGTQASPQLRTMDTWGYRVDSLAGFGAGPTNAEQNATVSSFTFAGLPASNQSAAILKTTSSAASNDLTKVWYGVAVDTNQPSGNYTTTVTYTAVTN